MGRRYRRSRNDRQSKHILMIGPWGGGFWNGYVNDLPGYRAATPYGTTLIWASDWHTSAEGVKWGNKLGFAVTQADVDSRQPLWDDAQDFFNAVLAQDWTAAETERQAILDWTP